MMRRTCGGLLCRKEGGGNSTREKKENAAHKPDAAYWRMNNSSVSN